MVVVLYSIYINNTTKFVKEIKEQIQVLREDMDDKRAIVDEEEEVMSI
jgi:protein involved in ribonucleotide reduction